jgi:hypothetical protein
MVAIQAQGERKEKQKEFKICISSPHGKESMGFVSRGEQDLSGDWQDRSAA